MKTIKVTRSVQNVQDTSNPSEPLGPNGGDFDLFRLSKSKRIVDISPNTLRSYFNEGLPFYKKGKATFVSKTELANFIRS